MSDELGSYRYAYPPMMPPPPQPAPAQSSGSDLAAMLIPVLLTMPALRTAGANLTGIQTRLSNLSLPADVVGGNPSAADFNALKNAVATVRTELQSAVGNDKDAFSAMSRGLMLGLIIPAFTNGQANGNNALMLMVLLMALTGSSIF